MADFDDDGFVDVYLLNGSSLDRIENGSPAPKAAFFRNNGDKTFRDNTDASGLANERWGQGVCAGDFDNDGKEDLYVANFGTNRLYRNVDGSRFTDVATAAGVAVDSWSTGCAFGDYDGDGWLDLYVAGYVSLDLKNLPPAPRGGGAPESGRAKAEPRGAEAPPPQQSQALPQQAPPPHNSHRRYRSRPRLHSRVAGRAWGRRTRPGRQSAPIAARR